MTSSFIVRFIKYAGSPVISVNFFSSKISVSFSSLFPLFFRL
ncbi:hypothetical protein [Brachyspira innocens]|nr:hypothetical protein [Brachyspira innocens]